MEGYNKEVMARAIGVNLPISTKMSVEVCNSLRGMNINKAKEFLSRVVLLKEAVPFRRFNRELAHKTKMGSGRYPIKVSKEILSLIDSVESNAQFKGLNTSDIYIQHINAHRAANAWHYGRMRRKMKRTTIEIVVSEKPKTEQKKESPKSKKEAKKPDKND